MQGGKLVERQDSTKKEEAEKESPSTWLDLCGGAFNTTSELSFESVETKAGPVPKAYIDLFNAVQSIRRREQPQKSPYRILNVLSGAIGVGKSTILYWIDKLQFMPGYNRQKAIGLVREPWVDDMNQKSFNLKGLYENPKENASRFQFEVLHYYTTISINLMTDKTWENHNCIIIERSPFDVLEVFLPVWRWAMPEAHYTWLLAIANDLCDLNLWIDAKYFYVNTSEELMLARVHERNRASEQDIGDVRLTQVHDAYRKFVSGKFPQFYTFENHNHKDLFKIVSYFLCGSSN